ncbi:barstar family protein [Streptomyces sp. NBC_00487]|uniref:barstar family protein n=1 Tax=unclassified Streptomyces TaxID=2593676 RepID=UPI002DDC4587|nr:MULTISPECIES: barstar family protein [unclassified Streptomyces]WRY96231.1 barstar family protein [Streptomyces sp. NBC_00481]
MTTDDLQDSWVDPQEILPWLPSEPYFAQQSRHDEVVDELGRAGFTVLEADLSEVRTEEDLLTALGRALSAPDYYGGNWDALTDVLRDRGADEPFRVALVLSSSSAFLDADVHAFVRSVSLLHTTAQDLSDVDDEYGQLELFYLADWKS